ncbi:VPA1269 family protein [Sphingomicrobium sp. XHP0235]|uniref:VPA1269 family protein n=1 Tax=Sphingomicrobium aquimarinum TaxID=3133971 RepID=UPI0031FE5B32
MTRLEPIENCGLTEFPNDPGHFYNDSEFTAVLRLPSRKEILRYWELFEDELLQCIARLWTMDYVDVVQQFGWLGSNKRHYDQQVGTIWGVSPKNFSEMPTFQRIAQRPAVIAAARANIIPLKFASQKRYRGDATLPEIVRASSKEKQLVFVQKLLAMGANLDEILVCPQGTRLGLAEAREAVENTSDVHGLLNNFARLASQNAMTGNSEAGKRCDNLKWLAPMWFSAFLVREGVWILPDAVARNSGNIYPRWLRPVQAWMTVPRKSWVFVEEIFSLHNGGDAPSSSDPMVIHAALELALASNFFLAAKPIAGPLLAYKRVRLENQQGNSHRSWAANRIWDVQLRQYEFEPNKHPDAHAFYLAKSLVSTGLRPFDWVRRPTRKNTRLFRKVFGCDAPASFSQEIIGWADELEAVLPLFNVEHPQAKIDALNLWLLFITTLKDPPKNFREITRLKHIRNDRRTDDLQFHDFVAKCATTNYRASINAMPTLRRAWDLASLAGAYNDLANPIDHSDTPVKARRARSTSSRSALPMEIAEILIEENLRDDFAFARDFGKRKKTNWRKVIDPDTGRMCEMFFPAAPVLIHIILTSGMRGASARWLDSGEGDEWTYDPEDLSPVRNVSDIAIEGRNEGFLRVCEVSGFKRTRVLGMWINSAKFGPYQVPWVDQSIPPVIEKLQQFQKKYGNLSKPIPIILNPNLHDEFRVSKGAAFPIARDPNNKMGQPISASILLDYWKGLLRHCEPIFEARLGHKYPLFDSSGKARFDIHSLRVSMITTLLENGVPVSVVQMLAGHKTPLMTFYYQDVSNHKIHSALSEALQRRKLRMLESSDEEGDWSANLGGDLVTLRTKKDFAGAELLASHKSARLPVDIFAHGICPGGKCETGGKRIMPGRYGPTWRPRACSSCRYRVTGPAFLNGLVQRANLLMWEIKSSTNKIRALYEEVEALEDEGRSVSALRSQARQEEYIRDHLLDEWCVEQKTVHECERMINVSSEVDRTKNAVVDLKEGSHVELKEVHELEMAHTLVQEAARQSANLDLPADVKLYRDQKLLEIAASNDVADLFYSLDDAAKEAALDEFGNLLSENFTSSDEVEDLISGKVRFDVIEGLRAVVQNLLRAKTNRNAEISLGIATNG